MRDNRPHRRPTTLDVLDHVLDKGVVIDTRPETVDTRTDLSIAGISVFGVDARVEVTDIDADARARSRPSP